MNREQAYRGRPIIRGLAATERLNANGDIVIPTGVEFPEAIPLLLEHREDEVLGIAFPKRTERGIEFEARLFTHLPGTNDQVAAAWKAIISGELRGVSTGYLIEERDKVERLDGVSIHMRTSLYEISLTRHPRNKDCFVTQVEFRP